MKMAQEMALGLKQVIRRKRREIAALFKLY